MISSHRMPPKNTKIRPGHPSVTWLEKAYGEHNDRLIYLGIEPLADPLRAEPRFRDLRSRVGLP
jgi:hypothetical protein